MLNTLSLKINIFFLGGFVTCTIGCGAITSIPTQSKDSKVANSIENNEKFSVFDLKLGNESFISETLSKKTSNDPNQIVKILNGPAEWIYKSILGPETEYVANDKKSYSVECCPNDPRTVELLAKKLNHVVTFSKAKKKCIVINFTGDRKNLLISNSDSRESQINSDTDGNWSLNSITTKELADFLTDKYHIKVVDRSGITTKFNCMIKKSEVSYPPIEYPFPLGNTGLFLTFETALIDRWLISDR